ncbi:hypothetical protein [Moraxella bovoculi]|uniref:hypothetical protein n=1 Tax=Moraxella bovoculi TaxID=386891 RepID=UPI001D03DD17|nr:hypothetical protein [Moraxella bovoculi]
MHRWHRHDRLPHGKSLLRAMTNDPSSHRSSRGQLTTSLGCCKALLLSLFFSASTSSFLSCSA